MYSADHKFVQNTGQRLLESITTSQKNSVFHEGFDSIIRFLSASTSYCLFTHNEFWCAAIQSKIEIRYKLLDDVKV